MNEAGWVIDVCRTCGALATYPFACGHRPEQGTEPWTYPVSVKPARPAEYRKLITTTRERGS
jgi:hypothetical protein